MTTHLSALQCTTLKALCDTIVPSIATAEDPTGFWARCASDIGVDAALAQLLATRVPEPMRAGLLHLLDVLADGGLAQQTQDGRQAALAYVATLGPEAAAGVQA